MFFAYNSGCSLLRAVVAAGGSLPLSALYSAFFMLIVLGFAKLVLVTKIDAASPDAGKGKGGGMSKNILGFVKLLFASLFDTVHGLGMSALAGVALP